MSLNMGDMNLVFIYMCVCVYTYIYMCVCVYVKIDPEEQDLEETNVFAPYNSILNGFYFIFEG